MSEIKSIDTQNLVNADLYQLIENTVNLSKLFAVADAILSPLAATVAPMQESFKKEKLNEETKKIVLLDDIRDDAFTFLKLIVGAFEYANQYPEKQEAARGLQGLIDTYGGSAIIKYDYNKETATLTNFVIDAKQQYQSAIDILDIAAELEYIDKTNNDFKKYYAERNQSASLLANTLPFTKLRKSVTKTFKNYLNDVESLKRHYPDDLQIINQLIDRINVEIEKFKLLIKKTPPKSKPEV